MKSKDMSSYRNGRESSRLMQTWLQCYKQQIMNDVIYRQRNPHGVPPEILSTIDNGSPETAEIVADTLIGWLNSPVGRQFISEAYGIPVPPASDGSE